jgi:hypothetical protein
MNTIPPITDPMGKSWRQPKDIRQAPMDGKFVLLTRQQWDALPEYSTSMPSGVYPGKCWKRIERLRMREGWIKTTEYLCWYGEHPDPTKCSNNYRLARFGKLKPLAPTRDNAIAELVRVKEQCGVGLAKRIIQNLGAWHFTDLRPDLYPAVLAECAKYPDEPE